MAKHSSFKLHVFDNQIICLQAITVIFGSSYFNRSMFQSLLSLPKLLIESTCPKAYDNNLAIGMYFNEYIYF